MGLGVLAHDLRDRIERRAYELWEGRGRPYGSPDVDWREAVKEFDQLRMVSRDDADPPITWVDVEGPEI